MKPLFALVALLSLVSVCHAAEGYDHEVDVQMMPAGPVGVKVGQVVKVTNIAIAERVDFGARFWHRRKDRDGLTGFFVEITQDQWAPVQYTKTIYVRKDAKGWVYLGTVLYRDVSGKYAYKSVKQ